MKNFLKFVKENELAFLTTLLMINLIFVGIFGLYKYTKILRAKYSRIEEMREIHANLENKLTIMNQTRADLNVYDAELKALTTSLPNTTNAEGLIVDLISASAKTGHSLDKVRPDAVPLGENYYETRVVFLGNPELLDDLLKNLESMPRLIEITDLNLSKDKEGETIIELDMKVFVQEGTQ